jgi:hypothetical protein
LTPDVVSGEHITVENQHRSIRIGFQQRSYMPNCPAGTEWYLLGHVHQLNPESGSVAKVLFKNLRLVGRPENDSCDTSGSSTGNLMLSTWNPSNREHGFGRSYGQWTKTSPLTADEEDSFKHVIRVSQFSTP